MACIKVHQFGWIDPLGEECVPQIFSERIGLADRKVPEMKMGYLLVNVLGHS